MLDLEQKKDKGGIFDKKESDSEVEEFMENLENDEMELDGIRLPSDAEEEDGVDDDEESGQGLDDYDDEEGFEDDLRDDFENSQDGPGRPADQDVDEEDGEAELNDVFERANENQEMDMVENLRR